MLETGSATVKAGYAGEDTPKAYFNTATGYLPLSSEGSSFLGASNSSADASDSVFYRPTNKSTHTKQYFPGNEAGVFRDNQEILAPVQHGLIMDFDAVEHIWDYALKNRLYADPYDHPILMAEPVYNTKGRRERTAQIMFERFNVPSLYLAKEPVLAAFSQGKPNALIVDIGAGKTTVVPVHDGYVLHQPTQMTKVAGDSLDAHTYRTILQPKGVTDIPCTYEYTKSMSPDGLLAVRPSPLAGTASGSYRAYMQQQVIRDLKESLCVINELPIDESLYQRISKKPFTLPDGNTIDVGLERVLLGESIFNPNLGLGSEVTQDLHPTRTFCGLQRMVCNTVDACDVDIRRDMYSNIILSGGGSLTSGLPARLQAEVTSLIPHGIKCRVNVPTTSAESLFATWVGGSVLSSLGTFHQMWVSRTEYEEFGTGILLRKCP